FVSARLYSKAIRDIGSGNEKGIATARDGASGVVFTDVDFGEYGSDEITLPIFALSGEQYLIDIWVGTPNEEESRLIDTVVYRKPSIWNVYQEQTYILPERIRGVADIGFMLHDKVHIKGFVFSRQEKAYGKLYGGEANAIYGDTFTRDGNIVRGIGNNVSVVYENMDFGSEGAGSVAICGRTPLTVNTIHIHFTDESGETVNRIVEFAGDGGKIQNFSIERLRGRGKVELIFLPGCNFDLESIQFSRIG
ncbi:MAG: glycoside hydrolase family 2, partial [Acetatifactor sp.]|nr:glycoside hydrolase family 2 [Acetatifactor sp.]